MAAAHPHTSFQCECPPGLSFWRCHVWSAVKTPILAPLSPNNPYFYWKLMALTQWPLIFFYFYLSPKASNFFQFQQQIGYFKWFCAQSSFLKLEIWYTLFLWDWNGSHWQTKNDILTQCPHNFGPKCSLSPNDPIFFQVFSYLLPLNVKISAYTYMEFIYECYLPPPSIKITPLCIFQLMQEECTEFMI